MIFISSEMMHARSRRRRAAITRERRHDDGAERMPQAQIEELTFYDAAVRR